ncbi:NAD(+)--arginine ADP-ribosyltransferase [Mycolicibacterium komossense]|uniref:NAD(+)--arginine ADP-ribosyltransferase n=1 Tax=Mycolicibacterium komossense TaxID=1779 RepID=A0ABT3CCB5_9MYCO|nr:NAD(+)--arginine ADP-ribosyltransferase [Mycolicibacterium komossense]MCV7227130.1 NAD(+)--arginine ADP-ribosyltransferase [Mycolicibacterium komossense]
MAPLIVDPAALDGAGASLVDVGKDIGLTLSTLSGTLSGCGSMCGNDPVGEAMGNAYDRSADALLKGMATARNGLVNLGDGVRMSAFNYSIAEAQSDVSGRAQPLPAPTANGKISASSAPSSVGAGDSAPAGWGWVAKYIGMIWPNGDSAKLRSAAGAWVAAGTQLLVTEASAAGPLGIVGTQQIPEGEMMGQMFPASLSAASQIMSATASLASTLTTYAGQIDATHAAIVDLLSRICDPMTGIKEIWDILTDEDEDEIKQIADDIKTVVDSFSAEASALATQISTEVSAVENVMSGLAPVADKVWDQFLHGTDVGRAINQVGQAFKGVGLEAGEIVGGLAEDAWKYNQIRALVDPKGFFGDLNKEVEGVAPLVGLGGEGAPGVLDLWKQVGKDVSHWDMWSTNPAEALGRTVTDVGSFFIPGGAEAKVANATKALENVADHLPGVADRVAGAVPEVKAPEIRPPTPEVPAPRPAEPVPAPAPRPGEPTPAPAPRPAEPSSLPPEAPRPTSPTESRPPAAPSTAPHEAPSTPAASGEGAPTPGGHGVPETAPAPTAGPSPGGHEVPVTSPSAGAAGAPKLPDLGGMASAAGSAGEGVPKLPDLGGMASSAGGAGDDLLPAGVGAHSAEAVDGAASHGHGPGGEGPGHGSGEGSGGLHSSGGDGPGMGGDGPGSGGDHTPPGDRDLSGPHDSSDPHDPHDPHDRNDSHDDQPGHGLTDELRDQILATEKGHRPDPSEYLSPDQIERHLERFDQGVTRFMVRDNLEQWGIGQTDGTSFVFPSAELDNLMSATGGDLRRIEESLGLPDGFFKEYDIVRVDIDDPRSYDLRVPSGNEAGANSQWLPGGFLPKGMPEAVIAGGDVPRSDYRVTELPGDGGSNGGSLTGETQTEGGAKRPDDNQPDDGAPK